jgi:hypothetical protein
MYELLSQGKSNNISYTGKGSYLVENQEKENCKFNLNSKCSTKSMSKSNDFNLSKKSSLSKSKTYELINKSKKEKTIFPKYNKAEFMQSQKPAVDPILLQQFKKRGHTEAAYFASIISQRGWEPNEVLINGEDDSQKYIHNSDEEKIRLELLFDGLICNV